MTSYLRQPVFWVSVLVVAVVLNYIWQKFFGKSGNIA